MHLAGADTRVIAEELYQRGARAQTVNPYVVSKMRRMSARTDNQARHFLNTVSGVFKWAIAHELSDGRNPAEGITRTRNDGGDNDGHLAWPIQLIEQYEKRWPIGTKQRLVFDVYLYVDQARHRSPDDGKEPGQDADLCAHSPRVSDVHQGVPLAGACHHRQG